MGDINTKYGIDSFYQNAINLGFARNFQFRVLRMGDWLSSPADMLYITTASMPGRTINSIAVPYMGLNFQMPGAANYNSNAGWQVQFRCDERLNVRNILENWSFGIFDDRTSKGANIPNNTTSHSIDLVSIDNLGNPRKAISLIGAWCQTVGDLGYDLTGNGTIVTINCTIAYQYWRETERRNFYPPAQPGDPDINVQ